MDAVGFSFDYYGAVDELLCLEQADAGAFLTGRILAFLFLLSC